MPLGAGGLGSLYAPSNPVCLVVSIPKRVLSVTFIHLFRSQNDSNLVQMS